MTYVVLVNEKAGTVRDRGRLAMKRDLESAFDVTGSEAEIRLVHPRNLEKELRSLVADAPKTRSIIVGGGDGTLSLAAGILAGTGITLGVLPLGTMNLFARALLLPLDLMEAVRVLVGSSHKKIDMLDVNGESVLMHASIGLQPRVIRIRESLPYRTRATRLLNGLIAWIRTLRRPNPVRITGHTSKGSFERTTSALLISNNALPEEIGETPVSQDMSRGEIGVYVSRSSSRSDIVKLTLATSLGIWRQSDLVEEFRTGAIDIDARKPVLHVSLDGEVRKLETPLKCSVRRRCLSLLMPRSGTNA